MQLLEHSALPPTLRELCIRADDRALTAAAAACYRRVYMPAPEHRPACLERITLDVRHYCLVTEFSPSWNETEGSQPDGSKRWPWWAHEQ